MGVGRGARAGWDGGQQTALFFRGSLLVILLFPEPPAERGRGEEPGLKGTDCGQEEREPVLGTAAGQGLPDAPPPRISCIRPSDLKARGADVLLERLPHPEPPTSSPASPPPLRLSRAGARLRDGLPAVGSLGRWPGPCCVCQEAGATQGCCLSLGAGVCRAGAQGVVVLGGRWRGSRLLRGGAAAFPKALGTKHWVDKCIKSWPKPQIPRHSVFARKKTKKQKIHTKKQKNPASSPGLFSRPQTFPGQRVVEGGAWERQETFLGLWWQSLITS